MSFGKKALLFGLSLLTFMGTVWVAHNNFDAYNKKTLAPTLFGEIDIQKKFNESFRDFLLKDSTYLRINKNTIIQPTEEFLTLQNGNVFFAGTLLSKKPVLIDENTYFSIAESLAFVKKENEFIQVYAIDKPVKVNMGDDFFIVPSFHSITISRNKTFQWKNLSHQSIGKNLKLTPWEESDSNTTYIRETKEGYDKWRSLFRSSIFSIPTQWDQFRISGIGKVIRDLQIITAIYIPGNKRANWFFAEKTKLLKYSLEFLKNKEYKESALLLKRVSNEMKLPSVIQFFDSFPNFEQKWNEYQRNIALYTNFSNNQEAESLKNLLPKNVDFFAKLENQIIENKTFEAIETIQKLKISPDNRSQRIRLFWNILQNPILQKPESIELYISTIDFNEPDFETEEIQNEIFALFENRMDHQSNEIALVEALTPVWNQLAEKKSPPLKQREFAEYTIKNKKTGLTNEEIAAIKIEEALIAEQLANIEKNKQNQTIETETETTETLQNPKELMVFLNSKKITLDNSSVKTNKETQSTSFEGMFKHQKISGTFFYGNQYFQNIKINNEAPIDSIYRDSFVSISKKLEQKENQAFAFVAEESPYKKHEPEIHVSQDASNAIITRKLILDEIKSFEGLQLKNIKVLNNDLNEFLLTDVSWTETMAAETSDEEATEIQLATAEDIQIIYLKDQRKFKNFVGKIKGNIVTKIGNFSLKEWEDFVKNKYETTQPAKAS